MAVVGGRAWVGAVALGMVVGSTGCVERLIYDLDGKAEGSGGEQETESDGIGETEQLATTGDPDAECSIPQDCAMGQTCFEGVCVGTGTVRVSLSWNVVTDLDLHLRLPNGDSISYESPITIHGELDVDDCVSATCVNQDGTHVESIFLESTAPRGTYAVHVVNFDGRLAADYAIEVAGETSAAFTGTLPAETYVSSPEHLFTW